MRSTIPLPRVVVLLHVVAVLFVGAVAFPGALGGQSNPYMVHASRAAAKYEIVVVQGSLVRLRTVSGAYLHLDAGTIDSGSVASTNPNAHWYVEATGRPNAYGLKNRGRNTYLLVVNQSLTTGALNPAPEASWNKWEGRSVKFLATADPQFENNPDENDGRRDKREMTNNTMSELVGRLSDRRGLIIAGDLTQEARRDEWAAYVSSLSNQGAKVYDGFGNHDLGGNCCIGSINRSDYCRCAGLIASDLATRTRETPTNRVGNHYSWDWADVHFVHLNLYPGMSPGFEELDPQNSLAFLKTDLTKYVGTSGRPVVLIHHYSLDGFSVVAKTEQPNPWWTQREVGPYWDAIADYNVVALITGHLHASGDPYVPQAFWYRAWSAPPTATRLIRRDGVQRPTTRTSGGVTMGLQTIDSLAARLDVIESDQRAIANRSSNLAVRMAGATFARPLAEVKAITEYIPMFPGNYGQTQAQAATLNAWRPELKMAVVRAMMPTIPVFIVGGGVLGFFVDFEITDTHLLATRYQMGRDLSNKVAAGVVEQLRLPLRPPIVASLPPSVPTIPGAITRTQRSDRGGVLRGTEFREECSVAEVRVRGGWWIDGVQVVCREPGGALTEMPWHGGTGGVLFSYKLKPDEYITALDGTHTGQDGQIVYSLQIVTNKGKSPLYGNGGTNKGQQTFHIEPQAFLGKNFGLYGSVHQNALTSIGLISGR